MQTPIGFDCMIEARERLQAINSRPKPYPNWVVSLATMAAAFAITLGIGGGLIGALLEEAASLAPEASEIRNHLGLAQVAVGRDDLAPA